MKGLLLKNKKVFVKALAAFLLVLAALVVYFLLVFPQKNSKRVGEINEYGVVLIYDLDKDLIQEKIEQGKGFLLRAMDESTHGFFKMYDAPNDDFGRTIYGVYSASSIYTLLNVYNLNKDGKILEEISGWGEFLSFMQNKDEKDKRYGAFHYSYDLDKKEKEKMFVVGTSAKSIFALLKLYQLTNNSDYLDSAKLAGNWLTTMQRDDGSMKPYVEYKNEKWMVSTKESILYNGQVLSALSRLYIETKEKKYYDAAKKIAEHFAQKIEEAQGGFIDDDYRSINPISNSWVVMSFIDFYKATREEYYKEAAFKMMNLILGKQKNNPENVMDYGQFNGAYSTSGNGWIAEVMSETYEFCQEEKMEYCDKYKESLLKVIRWVIQFTYIKENSDSLKNPARAEGGIFWDKDDKYVRIDSVCHALNGYINIFDDLKEGVLISIPKNN